MTTPDPFTIVSGLLGISEADLRRVSPHPRSVATGRHMCWLLLRRQNMSWADLARQVGTSDIVVAAAVRNLIITVNVDPNWGQICRTAIEQMEGTCPPGPITEGAQERKLPSHISDTGTLPPTGKPWKNTLLFYPEHPTITTPDGTILPLAGRQRWSRTAYELVWRMAQGERVDVGFDGERVYILRARDALKDHAVVRSSKPGRRWHAEPTGYWLETADAAMRQGTREVIQAQRERLARRLEQEDMPAHMVAARLVDFDVEAGRAAG